MESISGESEQALIEIRYEHAIDALIQHYTEIDKAVDSLPVFSLTPLLQLMWSSVKFPLALYGDLFLILPINAVILVRNMFPGRWKYVCWSWKYMKTIASWIKNGECTVPGICIRPLTASLLHMHFRDRLSILRRRVLLEASFSDERTKIALAKIDRARAFWGATSIATIFLTWIPVIVPVIDLVKPLVSFSFPTWSGTLLVYTFSYILNVPVSAFLVKRGLMLNGSGQAAMYPGFLPGSGYYERERQIFKRIGLSVSEFPVDAAVITAGVIFSLVTLRNQMDALNGMGLLNLYSPQAIFIIQVVGVVVPSGTIVLALRRRKKLGRS